MLGPAQIIFLVNFFLSLFCGKRRGRNPWHSNTLEWTAPSPPPHGNFETPRWSIAGLTTMATTASTAITWGKR